MAIPKQKPVKAKPDAEEKRQLTLDDIDDPELRAELEAWERASIEDFLRFEAELDDDQ